MRHLTLDNERYNTALTTEGIVQIALAHRRWTIVQIRLRPINKKIQLSKLSQLFELKQLLFRCVFSASLSKVHWTFFISASLSKVHWTFFIFVGPDNGDFHITKKVDRLRWR